MIDLNLGINYDWLIPTAAHATWPHNLSIAEVEYRGRRGEKRPNTISAAPIGERERGWHLDKHSKSSSSADSFEWSGGGGSFLSCIENRRVLLMSVRCSPLGWTMELENRGQGEVKINASANERAFKGFYIWLRWLSCLNPCPCIHGIVVFDA